MARSATPLIVVGSLAELLPLLKAGSPPPQMFATLVIGGGGHAAGLTTRVSVIGLGLDAPAAITVLLVQVAVLLPTTVVEQFQPVPVGIDDTVKPVGKLSVTVIAPLVLAVPVLLAVNVYVPLTPTVK